MGGRRRKRKLPVWLTPEECQRLLDSARSERDRLIILCGLFLGLRVSEIVGLLLERIDLDRGQVLVYQGKGGKDRVLPIHQDLVGPLVTWIAGRKEGWLFPSPRKVDRHLSARAVQYMVEACAKRAGIRRPDPTQRISPHKLRHTCASMLVDQQVPLSVVKDFLGHESIATTNIYVHANASRMKSEIAKLKLGIKSEELPSPVQTPEIA